MMCNRQTKQIIDERRKERYTRSQPNTNTDTSIHLIKRQPSDSTTTHIPEIIANSKFYPSFK